MAKSIKTSRGMLVFGSALLRVAPDVAVINLSVATAHGSPEDAFEETRKNARSVREFLAGAKIEDVDPDRLWQREGHVTLDSDLGFEGSVAAFDPGAITVRAGVHLLYELAS